MLDWLSWPADLLLNAGAVVASWFVSKDATNFALVQMMVATLVLEEDQVTCVVTSPSNVVWLTRRQPSFR